MNMTAKITFALLLAITLARQVPAQVPDQAGQLEAEVKALRATVQRQAEQIAELKRLLVQATQPAGSTDSGQTSQPPRLPSGPNVRRPAVPGASQPSSLPDFGELSRVAGMPAPNDPAFRATLATAQAAREKLLEPVSWEIRILKAQLAAARGAPVDPTYAHTDFDNLDGRDYKVVRAHASIAEKNKLIKDLQSALAEKENQRATVSPAHPQFFPALDELRVGAIGRLPTPTVVLVEKESTRDVIVSSAIAPKARSPSPLVREVQPAPKKVYLRLVGIDVGDLEPPEADLKPPQGILIAHVFLVQSCQKKWPPPRPVGPLVKDGDPIRRAPLVEGRYLTQTGWYREPPAPEDLWTLVKVEPAELFRYAGVAVEPPPASTADRPAKDAPRQ
jgi:hypothetical protein